MTHVVVTPEVAVSGSTVEVGTSGSLDTVVSGHRSSDIPLDVGDNEIIVRVTASDNTTQDYTVTVRRVPAGTEWHATVVPEEITVGGVAGVGCADKTNCDSQLTDNEITVGGASNHIRALHYFPSTTFFQPAMGSDPSTQLQALKFCVGPTEHSIGNTEVFFSASADLGWTAGVPVSLSIGTSCVVPTLVSNLDQETVQGGGVDTHSHIIAQGFTTGIYSGGYTLTSVTVDVARYNNQLPAENARAELWSADPDGGPQSQLADLTVPSSLPAGSLSLQAPEGTTLAPRTNYYVLVYTTSSGFEWILKSTNSVAEDSGGAAGWSIADRYWYAAGNDPSAATSWTDGFDPNYPQQLGLVQMSVQGTAHGEPVAPTPTNLTAQPGGGKVFLSWEINRLPIDPPRNRYVIEYGEHPDGPLTTLSTPTAFLDKPTIPVEGLTPGTTYRFRVRTAAIAARFNSSPWTQWVTATPLAPPSEPTGLTVAAGNRQLDLSWTAPPETLTGYDVHYTASATVAADAAGSSRRNPATGWTAINRGTESDPPAASQTIPDLANGTTYRVRVRAKDATGESAWVYSTGTPGFPVPTALKVAPGNAQLEVSWDGAAGDPDRLRRALHGVHHGGGRRGGGHERGHPMGGSPPNRDRPADGLADDLQPDQHHGLPGAGAGQGRRGRQPLGGVGRHAPGDRDRLPPTPP